MPERFASVSALLNVGYGEDFQVVPARSFKAGFIVFTAERRGRRGPACSVHLNEFGDGGFAPVLT